MGYLRVRPNEICVVLRGIRFHVLLPTGPVRGFALELFEGHFDLMSWGRLVRLDWLIFVILRFPLPAMTTRILTRGLLRSLLGRCTGLFNGVVSSMLLDGQVHTISTNMIWVCQNSLLYLMLTTKVWNLGKFSTIDSVSDDHPVSLAALEGSLITRAYSSRTHRSSQNLLTHHPSRLKLLSTSQRLVLAGWLWRVDTVLHTSIATPCPSLHFSSQADSM